MSIMKPTNTMETEQHIRRIVIFGATGDLCKRKLIPALYELWKKNLLPENILIVGASRRDYSKDEWLRHFGDYPENFCHWLDFVSCDLNVKKVLVSCMMKVQTQHISYPYHQNDMRMLSSISKKQDSLMTQTTRVWLSKNPLGTILNLLIIYSQWWATSTKNRFIASTIILAKILLTIFLLQGFGNILLEPLWNREYISEVQIFATETLGCDGRAQYYDTAGVVRDMLQNHMLQVLSLIAMDAPCRMDAKEIRREDKGSCCN